MADEPAAPTYAELSGEVSVSEVNLNESEPDSNTQYRPPPFASPYPAGPQGSQPYPPHGNQAYPPTGNPPYSAGGPYQPPAEGGPYQPQPQGGPYPSQPQGTTYPPQPQSAPYQAPSQGGPYQPPPKRGNLPSPIPGGTLPTTTLRGTTPTPCPGRTMPIPTPRNPISNATPRGPLPSVTLGAPPPSYNLAIGNVPDARGYPPNLKAPAKCELGKPEDFPDIRFAEGQRTIIDQLQEKHDRKCGKWICIGLWTTIAHVGFFSCIAVLVWQVPLKKQEDAWFASLGDKNVHESERPPYNMHALTSASVFLIVCYIIGVIEGWMSGTRTYVSDINKLSDFRQEHKTIRSKVPIVMLEARAYHYANQERVWKNGVMVFARKSKSEHKCVSFVKRIAFPFSRCVDASGDLDYFKKGQINRFEFEKTFGFLDEYTQEQFKVHKEEVMQEVKFKDEGYELEVTLVLPEMKEKTTVYMYEGCRTSLMSSKLYCFLIFTMLTWPYRLFFRCATRKRRYAFVKLIAL